MPRQALIPSDVYPYQVVSRSNNKEFFSLPLDDLWPIFMATLWEAKSRFSCCFHAFVLMSNHYHLIISTPKANLAEVMEYINGTVAKAANKQMGKINHFFGGRYKWTIIQNDSYYWNSIKYVFRNPVDAGLCQFVEDYKYSSLNSTMDSDLWDLTNLFMGGKRSENLAWLNHKFKEDQYLAIQKALRRREFKLPKNKHGHLCELDRMRPEKVAGT